MFSRDSKIVKLIKIRPHKTVVSVGSYKRFFPHVKCNDVRDVCPSTFFERFRTCVNILQLIRNFLQPC